LVRSRYSQYKRREKWTLSQKERTELIFDLYPDIEKAYKLSQKLTTIFNHTKDKVNAFTKLAKWHEEVRLAGFKSFNTISKTRNALPDNRSTNASAESFNAKIKSFRSRFRGVRCVEFFLFRLTNLYA